MNGLCISDSEVSQFGIHEESFEDPKMARRIQRAAQRKGTKQACAICGDEWFVSDMVPYKGNRICKFCNLDK
jgi:hypothetical protein